MSVQAPEAVSNNLGFAVDCKVRDSMPEFRDDVAQFRKTPRRRVSEDYTTPKWLTGVKCPYQYTSTFDGKYGIINYELVGNRNAHLVICFHGLSGSLSAFKEVQTALVKFGFQVLSFDLYGHGLSACPHYSILGHTYNLQFFLDQTTELLEHIGLSETPCSLLGFSMGCVIACGFANAHPNVVKRIVLIAPAGMLPNKPFPVRLLRMIRCCIPCSQSCICRCCFTKHSFLKRCAKAGTEPQLAEMLYNRIAWSLFVKKGSVAAVLGCAANMPLWSFGDTFQNVGQLNTPVLLLWGQNDGVSPVSASTDLLSCFPNGHLIVFKGGTHLLLADKCYQVNATILTYLQLPLDVPLSACHHLLPFSPKGHFIPRYKRCPSGMNYATFVSMLDFKPCHESISGRCRETSSEEVKEYFGDSESSDCPVQHEPLGAR